MPSSCRRADARSSIRPPNIGADVQATKQRRTRRGLRIADRGSWIASSGARRSSIFYLRAALDVAHVFVVPVRHQHHDHLQPVQFFRPDEGVLNPTPTLFILQLFNALFTTPLEAGVGETAVRLEVFLRPL